ncbi:hypothetical protein D3C81_1934670 [compost metagenome]
MLAIRLDPILPGEHRVHLALRLTHRQAFAVEHHAGVVERAVADFQGAVDDARFGQYNRTRYQRHVEFPGQSSEQCLVVSSHCLGLHAQMSIVQSASAFGADQGADKLQGIAHRQPVHGFF